MRRSILIYLILIIHVYTFARSPIATTEGEPSSIVGGCLNAITGEAIFQENDIVIAGVEPIRLPRIYLSGAREGEGKGWFYTSDLFAIYSEKTGRIEIPERNGTILKYIRERGSKGRCRDFERKKGYRFVPEITENGKGWTNSAKGSLSGRNNQKNYNVFLDHDKEQLHFYRADGSSRVYKKVKGSYELFALQSEKLSNGNNVIYGYDDYGRLDSIETKNPGSTVRYAFAHFHFWGKPSESQNVDIETSDGRYLSYRYRREGSKDNPSYYLMEISAPGIQSEHIEYLPQVTNPPPLVNKRMFPNGRVLATDFYHKGLNIVGDAWVDIPSEADPRYERVKAVMAPVGKDGSLHLAMRMFYYPESFFSQVFDLYGNLTVYHYTAQQRLSKIERFDNHTGNRTLYHTETLAWGPQGSPYEGFLFCKSLLNPQGLGIRSYRYAYDAFGNVIEEDVYGNLSGQCKQPLIIDGNHHPQDNGIEKYVVVRSYTQDDRHLLLSEHYPNGLSKLFQYIPDTDLLRAEFHCENGRIVQRHFYYYNQDLILNAEVLDDGSSTNDADLTSVTQRTKRILKLRSAEIFYGMPEVIEERYIDLATGKENLLSKTAIDYTTGGKISRKDIYDASGEFRYSLEFHYDGSGNLVKETNPIGQASIYEYDANLNRVRYTEPDNRCSHFYTYDFVNRLIEEKIQTQDGGEHTVRCEYDLTDNKIAEHDTFGNTTRHTYNGFGSPLTTTLSKVQDEDGTSYHPSIHREVDCEGHVIKETGPKGTTKEITYNARGKPIEVRHPDGTFETFIYNLDGQLRSSTNTDGTTTSFTYDVFGRETSTTITAASGEVLQKSSKEYTTFHLIREIDPNGNITEYFYDGAGRLEAEEFHHGDKTERTEYAYDTLGRLFSTRKGDEVQIVDRDLLGRTIEERVENSEGAVLRKTCTSYNAAGDVELVRLWIDDKESQEYFFYDGFHRLIQHLDPLGNKTQYSYDENALDDSGRRILQKTTIDPIGVQTIETFDVLGRLTHIIKRAPFETTLAEETLLYDRGGNLARHIHSVIASGTTLRQRAIHLYYDNMERLVHSIDGYGSTSPRSTEHSYTSAGQLETTTKPDGIVITRSYDPLGRLTEIQTSDGSCRYTFAYDGTGTLLQATDINTQQTFTRTVDGRGRLQEEVLPSGLVINREYDQQGNRKTLTLPDNSFVSYSFDGCNIASIQRHDPSGALAYAHHFRHYDLSGNLLAEEPIDNHTSITYHYDPLGRRSSVHSSWHKQTITDYDLRGLVKSVDWQNPLGAYTESFDYDELHQLTAENSLISHHYRYDSQGNRLVKDHAAMRIDDNNQLLFDAETHYNYDPNGNIESAETNGNKIRYTYDAFDRLITISSSDQIIRFTYDGIHRRISKTVESTSWSGPKAETTFYLYDNYFEIGSVNASGVIQNLRILGRTPKAETGAAIALEVHGKAYIPLHDIRGSVIALANPTNGTIEESYRYTSFGEEEVYDSSNTKLHTSRIGNPWRFASKRIDEETKFICFGRRYYIPKLGRWMTPDPEGYTDGPNLYSFLLNNPLACFDLYGLTALADKNDPNLIDHATRGLRSGFDAVCSAAGQIGSAVVSFAEQAGKEIGHYAKEAGHYAGETVYQVSHHLLPIPFLQGCGEYVGKLFSKKEHKDNPSQHQTIGDKPIKDFVAILVANGMMNSLEDFLAFMLMVSRKYDGAQVHGVYSKSYGFLADLFLCGYGLVGADWGDGELLAKTIRDLLAQGITDIILYTHSRINIIADNCFSKILTAEELSHIHLTTLGSPRYINNNSLATRQNYALKNDPVARLSPSFYKGKYTFMESEELIGHSVNSYETAIGDSAKFYKRKFKVNQ